MTLFLFVLGIGLLIGGAEALVRGSSRLAAALGISPLVVGLTVVAFGTSSPELAVTVQASLAGQADLAIGNVVGSNITNVLLILGIAAVLLPLTVAQKLVRLDVPIMIGVSVLMFVLGRDGTISRLDGTLLFVGIICYIIFSIRASRQESLQIQQEYADEYGQPMPIDRRRWFKNIALIIGGLGLLILGARWIVVGAVTFAEAMGVSQLVIGLTVIAVGTSLPEIAATVVASLRGERDIAVGNVVGSSIFNILAVLGVASISAPAGIPVSATALAFDIPVMIAVALACLPIFLNGHRIYRWEGFLFLGYYGAYTIYQLLNVSHSGVLPLFNLAMGFFVIPLTVVTLSILLVRVVRDSRRAVVG